MMSLLMLLLLFHVAVVMLALIINYIKIEHGTRNISVAGFTRGVRNAREARVVEQYGEYRIVPFEKKGEPGF